MRDPADESGTWVFLRKAVWKHKFAILPHRCRISKKWIWLKKGYKGVATYTGPGLPITETRWHTTGEHIKWLLTKDDTLSIADIIARDLVSVQPMADIFKKEP